MSWRVKLILLYILSLHILLQIVPTHTKHKPCMQRNAFEKKEDKQNPNKVSSWSCLDRRRRRRRRGTQPEFQIMSSGIRKANLGFLGKPARPPHLLLLLLLLLDGQVLLGCWSFSSSQWSGSWVMLDCWFVKMAFAPSVVRKCLRHTLCLGAPLPPKLALWMLTA